MSCIYRSLFFDMISVSWPTSWEMNSKSSIKFSSQIHFSIWHLQFFFSFSNICYFRPFDLIKFSYPRWIPSLKIRYVSPHLLPIFLIAKFTQIYSLVLEIILEKRWLSSNFHTSYLVKILNDQNNNKLRFDSDGGFVYSIITLQSCKALKDLKMSWQPLIVS